MGECGCTSNDERYTFPAPGKAFYILTLHGHCTNCDSPPGIGIELIKPDNLLYREYKRGEFINGPLKFEKWPALGSEGVSIVTGQCSDEFVKAMKESLVGMDVSECADGKIDEIGAEMMLEEMYENSQTKPTWLQEE